MLFLIGNYDCTPMILEGGYQMQRDDIYHEWEDGNGKRHRVPYTTRCTGTVDLKPKTAEQYEKLVEALKTHKGPGGLYKITAFINNLNEFELFNGYITGDFILGKNTGRKWWDQITLIVEEE